MSSNYRQLAKMIVDNVGGIENIDSLHHCQTRLRFKLKDTQKANKDTISKSKDVLKVVISGGQFQVVIGMQVADVYDAVEDYIKSKDESTIQKNESKDPIEEKKKSKLDLVADFISSIFSPIIPALAGAGMVKALLALLVTFNLISQTSQSYTILNMIGDGTFAFLPILLAFTTAQKLKTNPFLAVAVAAIMVHPTWATLVDSGKAIHLFNVIPLYAVKYTGTVIPVILVILLQAPIERFLNKIIPNAVRIVFAPMLLFLIMGILALTIVGPLGDFVGSGLTVIFTWLSKNASWAPPFLLGSFYSILVVFGLHHSLAPIGFIQLSQMGYDSVFGPGVLLANIGQGIAAIMVGTLSKDSKTKQIGASTGVTALMGVSEPAMYGLNFPKKYPLVAGAIGGACGGIFAGITATRRFATGSSGLPAVMMYIGDNTMNYFYSILISLAITMIVSAIATVVLFKKFEKNTVDEDKKKDIFDSKGLSDEVDAPVAGKVIPLSSVNDDVFSQKLLGDGVAIQPTDNHIYAPFDGEITALFPTNHAIGLKSKNGTEVLIHIGLNTVELKGKFFEPSIKLGDQVHKGQLMMTVDFNEIQKRGYDIITPIVITDTERKVEEYGSNIVENGDMILTV
jgi:PTS system beta-glucosides-specific IIC component